jgi:hypothetical protein
MPKESYKQRYWREHPEYRLKQLIYQRKQRQSLERKRKDFLSSKSWYIKHPERRVWTNMLNRCNRPETKGYKHYGGRGIKVLYNSYDQFISDVGKRPNSSLTRDRIDSNKHYEPGNCRWTTWSCNNKNRRNWRTNPCIVNI